MVSLKQLASFQKEMALGLAALALMLCGFGAAANWALWSYSSGARASSEVELTALALACAAGVERAEQDIASLQRFATAATGGRATLYIFERQSVRSHISGASTPIINLVAQLDFSTEITQGFNYHKFPNSSNQYRYVRERFGEWELYHCPVLIGGEWKTLALVRECSLLAGLERAFITILGSSIGIVALLFGATFALFLSAGAPYKRIQSQARSVGIEASDAESAVAKIVTEYRLTIERLHDKERDLVHLNKQLESHISNVVRVSDYLLSSMSTGVLILDHQGVVIGINERASQRLNVGQADELSVGKEDYVGLFADEPELKIKFDRAFSEARASDFDYELQNSNAAGRILGVSLIPLKESDGKLRELVALISDQTERVKNEKRLEDSRRLATLGEMSAGLAHQLRNSISAAMGFGALAHKRIDDKVAAREDINSLLDELHEEAALVERFLTYAKPLSLDVETTKLGQWLRETLTGSRCASRPVDGSEFEIVIEADDAIVAKIDTLLLKQVVVNLVDNARKVTAQERGKVVVSVAVEGKNFTITFSDNGPGIAPEEREKIFTPFYSSSPSGVGLGLPLARRIVALHGGRLFAKDSSLGGAAFVVEIPLEPSESADSKYSLPSESAVSSQG